MLLGVRQSKDESESLFPVYIPSHLTCLVGSNVYAALRGEPVEGFIGEPDFVPLVEIVETSGKDPVPEIRLALKENGSVCVKLLDKNLALASRIAAAFPDESIYILDEEIPAFSSRLTSEPEVFGKSEKECFDDFVADVTGYRKTKKETPRKHAFQSHYGEKVSPPKIVQKPKQIEKKSRPEPVITKALIVSMLKRDLLNFLFAIIFVVLTFLTTMGYFFLGADSSAFFGVICVLMAVVFPILSCVPIGFLYIDNDRRLRPMSLTLLFWFMAFVFIVAILSFIVLGLGNGNGWDHPKVVLHFFLNLSPLVYGVLRIVLDPLLRKKSK